MEDILAYVPLQDIEEFSEECNPVYKCPSCRWIFSPAPTLDEAIRQAVALLRLHASWMLAVEEA